MNEKKISFDTVYDAEAVRVVVNEVSECYSVLGVVHTSWPAISEAFDDYIANPKANGYRSLHTAVVGPRGRNLEVQIRTHKMHEEAEFGVCAHWAYKDDDEAFKMGKIDWMREVLHWQDEMYSENLFIDVTRRLEAPERIYISTPKGHVIDLPAGSTAVTLHIASIPILAIIVVGKSQRPAKATQSAVRDRSSSGGSYFTASDPASSMAG